MVYFDSRLPEEDLGGVEGVLLGAEVEGGAPVGLDGGVDLGGVVGVPEEQAEGAGVGSGGGEVDGRLPEAGVVLGGVGAGLQEDLEMEKLEYFSFQRFYEWSVLYDEATIPFLGIVTVVLFIF